MGPEEPCVMVRQACHRLSSIGFHATLLDIFY
ncbi:hypothetical protein AFE_0224 [Acidithiobacillus ferrooxidans ATCC 23270]|uniref:Uncharacterized protein n=2 Tax=root TaxID=1 RepID=B7J3W8_ACIF2|nr:hypothetical protein AFE_0224 [Acidithiobacillus ferrooxidans ATCC 23270]